MPFIKTYTTVQPQNDLSTFDIKRMEDIYDKFEGKPEVPHRHDYYTILLVKEASGTHIIDFHQFKLRNKQVFFISPGQVHQMIEKQKSFGFAITLSAQFMIENGIESWFIDDLHLFQDFGNSPPLEPEPDEFDALLPIVHDIFDFSHSNKKLKYQAVGALIKLFLIHCNNLCSVSKQDNPQKVQASISLLRKFKKLLNEKFTHWHKVSEYAEAFHITPDYLNSTVKSLSGKNAKEHIQSRILIAAKRHLLFSELNTKEIAFNLGFSEPGNFSAFFKKHTNISPSQFRKNR